MLVQRAAEIVGGFAELCRLLGVSETRMGFWKAGRVRLPDPIFLRLVDLVLQDDIQRASNDRRQRGRGELMSFPRGSSQPLAR